MRLYRMERVQEAEQDPRFLTTISRREKRQAAGRKSVETRRKSAIQWAASTPIFLECPTSSLDSLTQMAADSRNGFLLQLDPDCHHEPVELLTHPRHLDSDTLARLCTNLLRHECSDYDEALAMSFSRTGIHLAVEIIRVRIHREIAHWWPSLKNECWEKIDESGLDIEPDQNPNQATLL